MTETKVLSLSSTRILSTKEFIKINSLILKTPEEIILKIREIQKGERFFDFRSEVLVPLLNWEQAKEFLKPEAETEWEQISSIEEITQDFLDYMNFAWGKAEDQRGLSASRSINKLSAWLWALGRTDLEQLINDDDLYNPYGAPALIAVCEKMGIKVPSSLIKFSKVKCEED